MCSSGPDDRLLLLFHLSSKALTASLLDSSMAASSSARRTGGLCCCSRFSSEGKQNVNGTKFAVANGNTRRKEMEKNGIQNFWDRSEGLVLAQQHFRRPQHLGTSAPVVSGPRLFGNLHRKKPVITSPKTKRME